MGKQICYFAKQKDINELIVYIYMLKGKIIGSESKELSEEELQLLYDYDFCQERFGKNKFWITKPGFKLVLKKYGGVEAIDELSSEVIEFSLCTPQLEKEIDTSPVDNNFRKGGYLIIDDSDEYQRQIQELMKNPTYIDNPNYIKNGYEHGRLWYAPEYYDDSGEKIHKSKELDTLYNALNRYIRKNYRISKTKFGYIGPDAYQRYLEGKFIPCSGRNKIEFD